MEEKNEFTQIRVYKTTTTKMKQLRKYRRETYDDVIVRLVEFYLKTRCDENPTYELDSSKE